MILKGKNLLSKVVLTSLLAALTSPLFAVLQARADNAQLTSRQTFTQAQLSLLRSLTLSSLPPLPEDPSNSYADNAAAVSLGRKFFFDKGFSANGQVSCATCHRPEMGFTDPFPLAKGMGTNKRRTMPLIGVAYNSWLFWDGRKDSLWSQAIGPIESSQEHGFTRTKCAHFVAKSYKKEYEAVFGKLPKLSHTDCPPVASPGTGNELALKAWQAMKPGDRDKINGIYANIGKAVAAFVRRILPQPAPFDHYVDALANNDPALAETILSRDAIQGLRLFIGKARCTNCHFGPLFTNGEFQDIGLHDPEDQGRAQGIVKVLTDEFNCFSLYSDAKAEQCTALRFIDSNRQAYLGKFKVPTLRNVAKRPPYMHAGQFKTLDEVLHFYQTSSSHELAHQDLSEEELQKLKAFLGTLSGPLDFPQ